MTERKFVIDYGKKGIDFKYLDVQRGDKNLSGYQSVKVADLLKWLDEEMSAIPEDLLDTAVVSLFATGDDLSFCYLRPETDEELEKRLKKEEAMAAKQKAKKEKQDEKDRKEYERLKAMFGEDRYESRIRKGYERLKAMFEGK